MLSCDLFVILDDVTYSKTAGTNKNKIKSPEGTRLLSVPIAHKKGLIKDVTTFSEDKWPQKHWGSIQRCYARAPFWKQNQHLLLPIFENPDEKLADLNLRFFPEKKIIFFNNIYLMTKWNLL